MNTATIAENPEQDKERRHLPDDLDDFREALAFEIDRAPDYGFSDAQFVQFVAETIAHDYTMSPDTQKKLILLGLMDHVWDVLAHDYTPPPDTQNPLFRLSLMNWETLARDYTMSPGTQD